MDLALNLWKGTVVHTVVRIRHSLLQGLEHGFSEEGCKRCHCLACCQQYLLPFPSPWSIQNIKISPNYLYSCTHVSLAGVIEASVLLIRNTPAIETMLIIYGKTVSFTWSQKKATSGL
jgi:hypothetical protein